MGTQTYKTYDELDGKYVAVIYWTFYSCFEFNETDSEWRKFLCPKC